MQRSCSARIKAALAHGLRWLGHRGGDDARSMSDSWIGTIIGALLFGGTLGLVAFYFLWLLSVVFKNASDPAKKNKESEHSDTSRCGIESGIKHPVCNRLGPMVHEVHSWAVVFAVQQLDAEAGQFNLVRPDAHEESKCAYEANEGDKSKRRGNDLECPWVLVCNDPKETNNTGYGGDHELGGEIIHL